MFADGVEAIPYVRDAILYLQAIDTPFCVASSAKVEKMHMTLGASGLLPLLEDVLFSAWMVDKGKPAPDLFLHAADTMGFEPERCAVIEDSVAGVVAGKAAGMAVARLCGRSRSPTGKALPKRARCCSMTCGRFPPFSDYTDMTITGFLTYTLALGIAAAIPGPGVIALVAPPQLGSGFRSTVPMLFGLALGDVVYLSAAVLGLAYIASTFGTVFMVIKYARRRLSDLDGLCRSGARASPAEKVAAQSAGDALTNFLAGSW